MFRLQDLTILGSKEELKTLPEGKLLINTINAFSFNNALKDAFFQEALQKGDVLLPDGVSVVYAGKFLHMAGAPKERVAGWDLFAYEMKKLQASAKDPEAYWKQQDPTRKKPVVLFFGSSEKVLAMVRAQAAEQYPELEVVTYSPPYRQEFSAEENATMVDAINQVNPDLLWIGMTAPKQEKWTYRNWDKLQIHCHVGCIGAVFEFFGGSIKRAPQRWQNLGLEWLYRLLAEPKRMWRRYILGNTEFLYNVLRERLS